MSAHSFNAFAGGALLLAVTVACSNAQLAPAPRADGAAAIDAVANPAVPAFERDANWGSMQIVIYKAARTLAVYRRGDFAKEYPVVLGLEPRGRKRHANDARTPEGLYRIVAKRRHDRWQVFLALDYPNDDDRRAYDAEVRRGTIPDENGRPFAIGGSVGIHGNDRESRQVAGQDWTKGCVALKAADIAEVAALVPVGTPVWIVP